MASLSRIVSERPAVSPVAFQVESPSLNNTFNSECWEMRDVAHFLALN